MPKAAKAARRKPAPRAAKKKTRRNAKGQFQAASRARKRAEGKAPTPAPSPAAGPPPEEPLSELERIFVEHFLYHHSIVPLLAMRRGPNSTFRPWRRKQCAELLRSPRIRREIKHRRELQELANAARAARAKDLTPEMVKANLADAVETSWGGDRVRACNLALVVTGVVAKNELVSPPQTDKSANVYRALFPVPSSPAAKPPEPLTASPGRGDAATIAPDSPEIPEIEILDY